MWNKTIEFSFFSFKGDLEEFFDFINNLYLDRLNFKIINCEVFSLKGLKKISAEKFVLTHVIDDKVEN